MSETCKAQIRGGDGWHTFRKPCSRAAVIDGYCKQHHPDAYKERDRKRRERWNAQHAADEKYRRIKAAALLRAAGVLCQSCDDKAAKWAESGETT